MCSPSLCQSGCGFITNCDTFFSEAQPPKAANPCVTCRADRATLQFLVHECRKGGGRALSSHHPRQEGAAPVLYEPSSRIANCEKCGGSTAAAAGPRPAGRLVRGTRSSGTTGQKHNAGRQRSFRFYSRTRRHEGPRLKIANCRDPSGTRRATLSLGWATRLTPARYSVLSLY